MKANPIASKQVDEDIVIEKEPIVQYDAIFEDQEELEEEYQRVMFQIRQLEQDYPNLLQPPTRNVKKITRQVLENKKTVLKEYQVRTSAVATAKFYKQLFNMGADVVEKLSPRVGIDLQGFAEALSKQEEIDAVLSELAIKYNKTFHMQPEQRLALIISRTIYAVYITNTHKKGLESGQQFLNQPVNKKYANKYADLI